MPLLHRARAPLAAAIFVACAAPAPRAAAPSAPLDVPPMPASATAAAAEMPCTIEGEGEPIDDVLFHEPPPLTLAAARGGAPLVHLVGDARHRTAARWSELGAPGGDGRARLELERAGAFHLAGYAELAAVRFRLRSETPVVPGHVFLEAGALVRVAGADGAVASAIAAVPFTSPRELDARPRCADLAYDAVTVRAPAPRGGPAHVGKLQLFDAPRGSVVFTGDLRLFFVDALEERDGFTRIEGARGLVRIAGWAPSDQVDPTPRGAGEGGGGRQVTRLSVPGRVARIARETELLARRAEGEAVAIGVLPAGARVMVRRTG